MPEIRFKLWIVERKISEYCRFRKSYTCNRFRISLLRKTLCSYKKLAGPDFEYFRSIARIWSLYLLSAHDQPAQPSSNGSSSHL